MLVYTILPYKVEEVELKLTKNHFSPGELLTYSIAVRAQGQLGKHILRMNVLDPVGNEYEPYSCNITSQGGNYLGQIPLALNEKKGNWTIEGFFAGRPDAYKLFDVIRNYIGPIEPVKKEATKTRYHLLQRKSLHGSGFHKCGLKNKRSPLFP